MDCQLLHLLDYVFWLQVPVNCPVSGIVKQRKVQGSECYEVCWKDLDGLDSSVVPADLLQRYGVSLVDSVIYNYTAYLLHLSFLSFTLISTH